MIELAAAEVESADHCANCAIPRVQRNQRGLDLGKLHDLPTTLFTLPHANQRACANALFASIPFAIKKFVRELEAVTSDFDDFAAFAIRPHQLGIGRQRHRGKNIIAIGNFL